MIRLLSILFLITALSLGVAWLADMPGRIVMEWGNYHIEMPLTALLAGIALTSLGCILIYGLLFVLLRAPRSWLRSRLARHQTLGLEALTSTFAAIATQDIRTARRQIAAAQKYLPHQPLTLMLASQVARMEGNESLSRRYLEQMLKAEGTEFMALRGLIENARRDHDDDTAITHAQKALEIKGYDHWIVTTLVALYIRKKRSQDALKLIDNAARKRAVSRKEQRDFIAAVLVEYARPLIEDERFEMALPALKEALRHQPACVQASALLAKLYLMEGDIARALKVIAKAWRYGPHPLLTQMMLACLEPVKTRGKVTRMAEKLALMHPEHRESRFLIATLALTAGDAEVARNEARHLLDDRETIRACALMAEALHALGESTEASYWLKRSQTAHPEPGYECSTCHQPMDDAHLLCPHCGSIGSASAH